MTESRVGGAKDRIWSSLKEKLASGVNVQIVAMHPSASLAQTSGELACRVWENYMGSPNFLEHLEDCWATLRAWWRDYKATSLTGRLSIHGAYFLPLSINVVDPDRDEGFIVVSPRLAQEANSSRPQIIFNRKYEPKVFEFYWHWLINSNSNAAWRSIEKLGKVPSAWSS